MSDPAALLSVLRDFLPSIIGSVAGGLIVALILRWESIWVGRPRWLTYRQMRVVIPRELFTELT